MYISEPVQQEVGRHKEKLTKRQTETRFQTKRISYIYIYNVGFLILYVHRYDLPDNDGADYKEPQGHGHHRGGVADRLPHRVQHSRLRGHFLRLLRQRRG